MTTKIAIVGEAWGAKEEMFQHPFVGSSGAELARMLGEAGIGPALTMPWPSELEMINYWRRLREEEGVEITNVFSAHPQDNKIALFFTNAKEGVRDLPPLERGKYLRPELREHVETLWQTLLNLNPNLILAMGNTACWATLGESKIGQIRGTVKYSPKLNLKVLPTYHPAGVLRQWNLRTVVLADLVKAKSEAESGFINRIERWFTISPTLDEIRDWLKRPADFYAVDIETSIAVNDESLPMGQITMLGIARSASDALVIPFTDPACAGWHYWPSVEDEVKAWRLIDTAMKAPIPKVFQNGVYDLSYMLRLGLRPTLCLGDTMLLHHALYPEMAKSLGFLGSIYSNEIAWKTMRGKSDNLKRDE